MHDLEKKELNETSFIPAQIHQFYYTSMYPKLCWILLEILQVNSNTCIFYIHQRKKYTYSSNKKTIDDLRKKLMKL